MQLLAALRIVTIAVGALLGAPQQASDTFEVAVIRPNQSGSVNTQINLSQPGQLIVVNATVKTLLRNAYGLLPFQFSGGPKWQDEDMFDITAKTGNPDMITQEKLKPLLQKLLAERFRLKAYFETRQVPLYALVVRKGGPKFSGHVDAPGHGMNTRKSPGSVLMKGVDVPMEELASNLGNQLGRFVLDRTGLNAHYDFVLNWNPDLSPDSTLPSLFTALSEQLGLRLVAQNGPMSVLVIDSIEKPSEN
jgi:uncharacterized protein (TIGR03435 family)